MSDGDPPTLRYETPASVDPAARGVGVTDYGDRLVFTGPSPSVFTPGEIVAGAVLAAAFVGVVVYHAGGGSRGPWRLGASGIVLTLLVSVTMLLGFLKHLWQHPGSGQRVTEVTARGIRITYEGLPASEVEHRRGDIRRLQLVHGRRDGDGSLTCTLQIVLDGDVVPLFNGPAESLREIGVRMRQVLDLPY